MSPLKCFLPLLALLAATLPAPAAYEGPYPYKAVATTGMVADIVRNVAGQRAQVTQIIGAGVDPHLYTATRDDIVRLQQADVIFYSGLLLEGRMTDNFIRLAQKRPVYGLTAAMEPDYVMEKVAGHPDPHVWMDPRGWMQAAAQATRDLAEFDPANAAEYEANAARYRAELERLDEYARSVLSSIPEGQRLMITAHDAFGYLGRAYGIEVSGIQGISTESEAGLQDINRLVDLIVERRVPAIFVETSVSEKNVRALVEGAASRGHAVRIGGMLFSDAMGPAGTYEGTYIGMIDHNATTIARALGGKTPPGGMQGRLAIDAPVGASAAAEGVP